MVMTTYRDLGRHWSDAWPITFSTNRCKWTKMRNHEARSDYDYCLARSKVENVISVKDLEVDIMLNL